MKRHSWNLFGTIAWILKDQGINMLMNIFGGPAINAARGVSYQVANAVQNLVNGFGVAVNPQLTKNYASGNSDNLIRLMMTSSKISFFLLLLIALPVMIEITYLLNLWLVEVPTYTAIFTQLILIEALINTYGGPMITGLMATGKIKWYQIVVGSAMLLNVPVSYVLLHNGHSIVTPLFVSIFVVTISLLLRLLFCQHKLGFSIRKYFNIVIVPTLGVAFISGIVPLFVHQGLAPGFFRLLAVGGASLLSVIFFTYLLGLNSSERQLARMAVMKLLNKLRQ